MRVSRSTIGPAPSFTPRFIVLARATVIGVVMNRMIVCIGRMPMTEHTPTNTSGRMTSMLYMKDVQRFGASTSLAFLARRIQLKSNIPDLLPKECPMPMFRLLHMLMLLPVPPKWPQVLRCILASGICIYEVLKDLLRGDMPRALSLQELLLHTAS